MKTQITANLTITDEGSEYGDQYQSTYSVEFFADGSPIGKVGDVNAAVEGWAMGGWLEPGAHANLDGSGLPLWGDSQPGGWSSVDGDGGCSGKPRVKTNNQYAHDDYSDPIIIFGGEGQLDIEISPEEIGEWEDLVQLADEFLDVEDPSEDLENLMEEREEKANAFRNKLIEALEDALERVLDGSHHPKEPDAEEIFENISEIYDLPELPIRIGDYMGAGKVLAYKQGDRYYSIYHPDEKDVRRVLYFLEEEVTNFLVEKILE